MRLVFFGTPEFSSKFLSALHADPFFEVVAVITTPDEPIGRKKILTAPPTKIFALEHNLPVFQPTKLKDPAFADTLRGLSADAFVVVAYGRLIPQSILDLPALGCINVHPSLLPKLRGPSPIISAIADGEQETGVSIMKLDAGMDHGPILGQIRLPLATNETAISLTEKVIEQGSPYLLEILKKYSAGEIQLVEQNHSVATICSLITREDGKIDWSLPAQVIERRIRAYTPWPGTWTIWTRQSAPLIVKILAAEIDSHTLPAGQANIIDGALLVGTATNALRINVLQPAGGKPMDSASFLRGYGDIDQMILQ